MGFPHGLSVLDVPGMKTTMSRKLADFNLCEGDLVTLHAHGLNSGGVIYRIVKDSVPRSDAVRGQYTDYQRSRYHGSRGLMGTSRMTPAIREGWVDAKRKPINQTRLSGCIELYPVFSFMAFKGNGKKLVTYSQIPKRVQKIELVALASSFANFHIFLNQELKRLQGD